MAGVRDFGELFVDRAFARARDGARNRTVFQGDAAHVNGVLAEVSAA